MAEKQFPKPFDRLVALLNLRLQKGALERAVYESGEGFAVRLLREISGFYGGPQTLGERVFDLREYFGPAHSVGSVDRHPHLYFFHEPREGGGWGEWLRTRGA